MNKCRLFIVRHTQTIGNIEKRLTGREDYELTDEGKKYIKLMTQKLKNIRFDVVYSSPSGRAIKTVEPLAQLNNIPIIIEEDLSEMYFGIYDGWKWEDVDRVNPKIRQKQIETNEIVGIPHQETMSEVEERMYSCIKKIAEEHEGKTILISSHGVAIEAFFRKITGTKFSQDIEKFRQHNTAINELNFTYGKFEIIKMASIEHLKEGEDER